MRSLDILRSMFLVVASSIRVAWLFPRHSLPVLVETLRGARPHRLSADPVLLAAVAEKLLPYLPPWNVGPCVRRSLVLLDLWSRCGLEPSLHLGLRDGATGVREGHVWVTSHRVRAHEGGSAGVTETWRF